MIAGGSYRFEGSTGVTVFLVVSWDEDQPWLVNALVLESDKYEPGNLMTIHRDSLMGEKAVPL